MCGIHIIAHRHHFAPWPNPARLARYVLRADGSIGEDWMPLEKHELDLVTSVGPADQTLTLFTIPDWLLHMGQSLHPELIAPERRGRRRATPEEFATAITDFCQFSGIKQPARYLLHVQINNLIATTIRGFWMINMGNDVHHQFLKSPELLLQLSLPPGHGISSCQNILLEYPDRRTALLIAIDEDGMGA